jgi:hypothetical protein
MLNKLLFVSLVSITLFMLASCKGTTTPTPTTSSFQLLLPTNADTVRVDTVSVKGVWFKWQIPSDLTGPYRYRLYLSTNNNFPTSYVRASDALVDSLYFSYSDLKALPVFDSTKTQTFYWTVYVQGATDILRSANIYNVTITLP